MVTQNWATVPAPTRYRKPVRYLEKYKAYT